MADYELKMEILEKNSKKIVEKFDFSFFYLTFDDQSVIFCCVMHNYVQRGGA